MSANLFEFCCNKVVIDCDKELSELLDKNGSPDGTIPVNCLSINVISAINILCSDGSNDDSTSCCM